MLKVLNEWILNDNVHEFAVFDKSYSFEYGFDLFFLVIRYDATKIFEYIDEMKYREENISTLDFISSEYIKQVQKYIVNDDISSYMKLMKRFRPTIKIVSLLFTNDCIQIIQFEMNRHRNIFYFDNTFHKNIFIKNINTYEKILKSNHYIS